MMQRPTAKKGILWVAVRLLFAFSGSGVLAAGEADSLCAKVKIEIAQELTLERQAFEVRMRIHNGLAHLALENVAVAVKFSDEDGAPVAATSDPSDTSALFFLRQDSLENISAG